MHKAYSNVKNNIDKFSLARTHPFVGIGVPPMPMMSDCIQIGVCSKNHFNFLFKYFYFIIHYFFAYVKFNFPQSRRDDMFIEKKQITALEFRRNDIEDKHIVPNIA